MKVSEIMTEEVMSSREHDKLTDCARVMKDLNVGAIPIVDDDRNLLGIITDRDIAVRATAKGVDTNQALVGDFMTPNPITVEPGTDVEDAAEIMADNQIRRLPVTRDGKLVGIVSLGDLAVDIGEKEMIAETLHDISVPVR